MDRGVAEEALIRAAGWINIELSQHQLDSLVTYGEWLIEEAIPAGAVGPEEAERIIDRHVADSMVFAAGWRVPPASLIDVGSGVGLPGIPLAIALPETRVTLLDRSQRRVDLAGRALRILGLTTATVLQTEAGAHDQRYPAAAVRAALPVEDAIGTTQRLLDAGGVAMIGLHRGTDPPAIPPAPPGVLLKVLETPKGVLDSSAWHLRMTVR